MLCPLVCVQSILLYYKTAAGANATIAIQNLQIVYFVDALIGKLRGDSGATVEGKQNISMQGRRMLLIYNINMLTGSTFNSDQCT